MKNLLKSTLAAITIAVSGTVAFAADHTLTISSWAPPTHGFNALMWPRFVEMIEEATDGRVTAKLKLGLAPPPAQLDLVQDGAADLSVIFHGYQPGRFVATKMAELPGYVGSSEASAVAYWEVHEKFLAAAKEHRGVKVVGLFTHGPAQLHSDKTVTTLSGIANLKIRVPGGVGGDVSAALGATGIQVPAPKVYETLSSHAADGVVMPVESRGGFKLIEVAKNMYEIPGGFYRGSFAFIMNNDSFSDLPKDLQAKLESKVFGANLSRELGRIWDGMDAAGRKLTMSTKGNVINPASEADTAAFNVVAAKVRKDVLAQIAKTGIDADAAHAKFKEIMAAN